ncbi:hypothetical protein [Nostoc favosum]|nr:hypothetical protein [Nostoc favosum]
MKRGFPDSVKSDACGGLRLRKTWASFTVNDAYLLLITPSV